MKKNKMMRFASLVLVLTLLSTCAISGTFAKYTTTTTSQDSARVAHWGFEKAADISITDLFKTAYDKNVQGYADVIAPGTTNSASFSFNYDANGSITAPEVAYTFTVSTEGSSCDTTIQNNPNIQWRLNVTEAGTKTEGTWGTWTTLISNIQGLAGSGHTNGTKSYTAQQLPEAFDNDQTYEIEWKWIFDDVVDSSATDNDTGDTTMGNADTLAPVTVKITITAEQVD